MNSLRMHLKMPASGDSAELDVRRGASERAGVREAVEQRDDREH
jgi:hypothetical protein